jgi:hypothetical protein
MVDQSECKHPPADAIADLYCSTCGTLVVEGIERCGQVDGVFVCLERKGHRPPHLGVDTTKPKDVELLIPSRTW